MRLLPLTAAAAVAATVLFPVVASSAEPPVVAPVCETVVAGAVTGECLTTGSTSSVNEKTFEPTMGAAPDGSLYFSTTPTRGLPAGVGFGASISRSTDGGATWADVGARVAGQRVPFETNDPYIYVDPGTGRVFEFHMSPILTCATLSWSDDAGKTWTNNPAGCGPTGAWDHQTMVAAKPRTLTTNGYPNILHQCVNAVYAEMCSRSLDGGLTWMPSNVAWPNDKVTAACGTQTGHLAAAPDGTLYLPTSDCGSVPTLGVSRDDGLTWKRVKVADIPMPFDDPAVAVDHLGNVYVAFMDRAGQLYHAVSRDSGATWSAPVKAASAQVDAAKLAMTVGDPGKITIASVATGGIPGQEPGRKALSAAQASAVRWGAFMTTSLNALAPSPTFSTLEVTGTDPLFNTAAACGPGQRCAYIVDFIGAAVSPDGVPYGAFVDGCTGVCAETPGAKNNMPGTAGTGLVARVDVDLCEARCPRLGPAPAQPPGTTAAAPAGLAPAPQLAPGHSPVPGLDMASFRQLATAAAARRHALATGGAAIPK